MEKAILYPMIAQGALIFSVLFLLAKRRLKAYADKQTDPKYFKLFEGSGEPENVTKVQRNFIIQYEMPVLFFVVCLMAALFGKADQVMVYAAWAYVAARTLHTLIHVTSNNVLHRFRSFMLSNLILLFMWVWVAL
jgi:hypothetical protein